MSRLIICLLVATVFGVSCNSNSKPVSIDSTSSINPAQQANQSIKSPTDDTPTTASASNQSASVSEVITGYLQIKNALAADNGNDAAAAGKNLQSAIQQVDVSAFAPEQKKLFADVKDDMQEHAEHIGMNAGKIAHQREHFAILSQDVYDLVKAVKPGQALYLDYCPMYNNGKGATWVSDIKEIRNPYLGKKMPDCGTVKEEIK